MTGSSNRYKSFFLGCITVLVGVLTILSTFAHSEEKIKKDTPKKAVSVTRTVSGRLEMCLSCHKETPDKAHGREVLGCYVCHRGDPLSGDMSNAHRGMILNPGELKYAKETCGQESCHPREVDWVKNSLMATNRGIISTLRYYWGETKNHNEAITVEYLKKTGFNSPATDYFRKLCGSCHLWLERRSLPDFLGHKGGGCTACHLAQGPKDIKKDQEHPYIIRSIPMENCIRCHNRSGRIGLSYQGMYETDGYGAPLEAGHPNNKTLEDGRFYQNRPEDIHHKTGLICIDCHTQKETMGDGVQRAHIEGQLEVNCSSCHGDKNALESMYKTAKSTDEKLYPKGDKFPPYPRLNIEYKDGAFFLLGKNDKKLHPLKDPDQIACKHPVHKSLSCQACHSTWVPQCFGCHVKNDGSKPQLDKLSNKDTPGLWKEFKGFMRLDAPPLGVLKEKTDINKEGRDKVVILVPG